MGRFRGALSVTICKTPEGAPLEASGVFMPLIQFFSFHARSFRNSSCSKPLDRGVLRDVDKFDFHHSRPVAQLLGSHVVGKNGWCAPPAVIQHSTPVVRSGIARHITRATGRFGMGMIGLTASISCTMRAQSAAHVDEARDNALASLAFKDETGGILFVHADAEGSVSMRGRPDATDGRPRAYARRGNIPAP